MFRRRHCAAALFLLSAGCAPSVPQSSPPASIVQAVFNPPSEVPQPNDLALQGDPYALPVPPAQAELLAAFQAQGGFPNDQEVPITFEVARLVIEPDGSTTSETPELDFSSFRPDSFFVFAETADQSGFVAIEPPAAADYVTLPASAAGQQQGMLTVHRTGRDPWAPGRYVVALRGGDQGVTAADGEPLQPSTAFYLIAQGEPLTTDANRSLLRASAGSAAEADALAAQLDAIIAGYQPAFAVVDTVFPHQELALLLTFTIAPRVTQVDLDPARGLVPLPIDLLRDPRPPSAGCPACGKLTPLAACTLAGGKLDAAGACLDSHGNPNGAAAGFATLDGFSTTATLLAPSSDLIDATTVSPDTIELYDLSGATPALVDPTTLVYEPCEVTESGLSPTIALQPAGATACDATSVFRTRPLRENSRYALLITTGVKDKTGTSLGIGTVGKLLLFTHALVDADGHSQLVGIDDETAGALDVMRQELAPVVAASPTPKSEIAMAYTFKTQSFLNDAVGLAALPYTAPAATALPGSVTTLTAAEAFTKYGVDPSVDQADIGAVLETTITTFNLLDPQTGAFFPDPSQAVPESIDVLIVTPRADNPAVPTCAGALAAFAPAGCAPTVVFRHGLGGGRADALLVADGLAAQGLVTIAIDASHHGDRSFCGVGDVTTTIPGTNITVPVCANGAACIPLDPPAGTQGDTRAPGRCAAGLTKRPVSASCAGNPACTGETDGIPVVSSSFLISANFFRTRDILRQDLIDQSQLVRALAFVPAGAPPTGNAVFDAMIAGGLIIDPGELFFAGQSLGAIQGALDVAANPRIARAVLNAGGGTLVDVFTTSPAFAGQTSQLLAGLGIGAGTPAYLQFLAVAKLVLDPADPLNYVGHLATDTLPNLLEPLGGNPDGSVPQAAKAVLDQIAFCDQVVPNPFEYLYAATADRAPLPGEVGFGGPGTFQLFYQGTALPSASDLAACPAPGGSPIPTSAVAHGFFTDWSSPQLARAAQADAAAFLVSDTSPASLVVLPGEDSP